jgi:hypothetical protein
MPTGIWDCVVSPLDSSNTVCVLIRFVELAGRCISLHPSRNIGRIAVVPSNLVTAYEVVSALQKRETQLLNYNALYPLWIITSIAASGKPDDGLRDNIITKVRDPVIGL